jgi:putative glutamine amidotransferase
MPAPLIGITTDRQLNAFGQPQIYIMEPYVKSVIQAGGAPVLIPLGLPDEMLKEILGKVAGVLLTGGGDIHPELYGGEPHPRVAGIDEDRDRIEIQTIKEILRVRKPFLGICRGLQLVNVAAGGTLYTHISDQHPQAIEHYYYPNWPREHIAHSVEVKPESRLAKVLGGSQAAVNSQHHQGIEKLAPGLEATAHAPDGLVEAVEMPHYPFGLAVQWHPEWLQDQAPMRSLFAAFVKAAQLKQETHNGLEIS